MIRELNTLIAVSSEGTFAAAADKIGLTQAAVSSQMKRLEQELGLKIFDRIGRAMVLNRSGIQVLIKAKEIIQLYQKLGNSDSDKIQSIIKIGAIASTQPKAIPNIISLFSNDFHDIAFQVQPGLSIELVDQVDSGNIDIAIIIRPPFSLYSGLEWYPLAQEKFVLIAPIDTPDNIGWVQILKKFPFIRYDRRSFGGRQVDNFLQNHLIQVHDKYEVDDLDAILELVCLGQGVAIIPQIFGHKKWPESIKEISMENQSFYREIGFIIKTENYQNRLINNLINTIKNFYDIKGLIT